MDILKKLDRDTRNEVIDKLKVKDFVVINTTSYEYFITSYLDMVRDCVDFLKDENGERGRMDRKDNIIYLPLKKSFIQFLSWKGYNGI